MAEGAARRGGPAGLAVARRAMPQFFFDTDNGQLPLRDEEGCELPDCQASRRIALEALTEMAGDPLPNADSRRCTVAVRDAAGRTIYRAWVELAGEWVS